MPVCNSAWRMLCRSADLSVQCSRLWRVSIASLIPMFPDARASLVNIQPAAFNKKPCNLIVARVSLILNYRSFLRVFLLPRFSSTWLKRFTGFSYLRRLFILFPLFENEIPIRRFYFFKHFSSALLL